MSKYLHQMNTEYANMAPAALAGPRYVRLWIDEGSAICQADQLPARLDKIVWQAGGHVYWFEMIEPTLQKVRDGIDSVLERGHGYRALVGATNRAQVYSMRIQSSPCHLLK